MAEKQKRKRALITIDTDIGKKSFFSIEDLKRWLVEEHNAWNAVLETCNTNALRRISKKWDETRETVEIVETGDATQSEKISEIKSQIEKSIDNYDIISSNNPIQEELINCKNNSEVEGFVEGLKNNPHQHIRNDQLRLSGYVKGQIYSHQTATKLRSETKKVESLIKSWTSDYEDLLVSLRETKKDHQDTLAQLEISQKANKEKLELLKQGFNQATHGLRTTFDSFLKDANDSLTSVKDIYEKHMSLRSSVNYWNAQAEDHKKKAKRAFVCVIILTVATTLFFITTGLYLINSATPDELQASAFRFSYGHAIKALIFALSLSFLIWAIKLSNKTWHIHKHLHHDANERVTMMQTYLALASDEKNLKENDVELILSSLFRPAYDGIIKDETAPRSLADIFMREGK